MVTRSNVCTHGVARARTAECLYRGNAERLLESRIVGQTHRNPRTCSAPLCSALLCSAPAIAGCRSREDPSLSLSLSLSVTEQDGEDTRKGGVKESQRGAARASLLIGLITVITESFSRLRASKAGIYATA